MPSAVSMWSMCWSAALFGLIYRSEVPQRLLETASSPRLSSSGVCGGRPMRGCSGLTAAGIWPRPKVWNSPDNVDPESSWKLQLFLTMYAITRSMRFTRSLTSDRWISPMPNVPFAENWFSCKFGENTSPSPFVILYFQIGLSSSTTLVLLIRTVPS